MLFRLARPAIFALDSETAHRLAIAGLKALPTRGARFSLGISGGARTSVAGLDFPNPVGVAAGFDKDAEVPDALLGLGFGFAEVGSITPRPQAGNPKPRLFRLVQDEAVINRMGFNNAGGEAALERLRARGARPGVIGINIGANKDSQDRSADYAAMARMMAPYASYLAINVSSPNTPGLRALQDADVLSDLIDRVVAARDEVVSEAPPPIFLKVAPDLEPSDIDAIARITLDKKLGALIVSNTTLGRDGLRSRDKGEAGGLSGAPLFNLSTTRLAQMYQRVGDTLPLVGVGGVRDAETAWQKLEAGASLVQLYTGMIYAGPGLPASILRGLSKRLSADDASSISEIVGRGADEWAAR